MSDYDQSYPASFSWLLSMSATLERRAFLHSMAHLDLLPPILSPAVA